MKTVAAATAGTAGSEKCRRKNAGFSRASHGGCQGIPQWILTGGRDNPPANHAVG